MKPYSLVLVSVVLILLTLSATNSFVKQKSKNRLNPTTNPDSKYKVYVPKDLENCYVELEKMLPENIIKEMKEGTEEDMIKFHHGLGTWLRNNWGLWGGSKLSEYFNQM